MISAEFLKRYEQSVEAGEDDYSLVDHSCIKPLKEKYKYTYGSQKKKK